MNREQILSTAISKARKNGYSSIGRFISLENRNNEKIIRYATDDERFEVVALYSVIFSPEFGIALWGEKPICKLCGSEEFDAGKSFNGETTEYDPNCKRCGAQMLDELEFGNGTTLPAYLYHQQKMLTYSEPYMYLEKVND